MRKFRRILLVFFSLLLLYVIGQSWDIYATGQRDAGEKADAAIVLGAAAWHDKPSPVLRERLNHAINLYKTGRVKNLLLTGGYGTGAEFSESQVARKYCLENGVPASALHLETASATTYENLREAAGVVKRNGWDHVLLVSDPLHLKRALCMAERLGLDAAPSATPTTLFQSPGSRAEFLGKEFLLYHQFLFFGE